MVRSRSSVAPADQACGLQAVGYHVGTVWPFDNSFIAWGMRRYGFSAQAGRIAEGIIDAAASSLNP